MTSEITVVDATPTPAPAVIDDRHSRGLRILDDTRAAKIESIRRQLRKLGLVGEGLDAALIRASVRAGIVEVAL